MCDCYPQQTDAANHENMATFITDVNFACRKFGESIHSAWKEHG